jgi:hypothetical protein
VTVHRRCRHDLSSGVDTWMKYTGLRIATETRPIHNISKSVKIRRSITSRHSEKEDDDIDAERLLPSVPIAESSVVLSPISPSSTKIISVGLVEGFVEGRIDRGKIAERCSFTGKSYLCTLAA